MPVVGKGKKKKEFPYSRSGRSAAKSYAKKTKQSVRKKKAY